MGPAADDGTARTVDVVEVRVAAADADLLAGELWAAGAVAVEEAADVGATTVVLRAARADGDTDPLVAVASGPAVELSGPRPVVRVVRVDDGLAAWRAHARPWRAGGRLVVWPAWLPGGDRTPLEGGPRPDDLVVAIDPERSFGSGAHASTRLALELLEPLVGPSTDVADVGCGSGVLAVAAALLGARSVHAVDLDPVAVEATRRNVARNGVDDVVVEIRHGSVDALTGPYDLVVANLLAADLRSLGTALAALTAPGGTIVLAGLLEHQAGDVVAAVGLRVERRRLDDGWLGLVLRR